MIGNVEELSVLWGAVDSTMDSDSPRHDIVPLTFELDTASIGSGRYLNNILHRNMNIHTREIVTTC